MSEATDDRLPAQPTEAMVEAACKAGAACQGKKWPGDFTEDELEHFRFAAVEGLMAAAEAAGEVSLPAYEPPTCGSDYLTAERAMRVVERATMLGEVMDCDAIEALSHLADRAGTAFARVALHKDEPGGEVPF